MRWTLPWVWMVAAAMAGCYSEGGGPTQPTATPGLYSDADGDGWTISQGDCADQNPAIHPGADEVCDADDLDENCNGLSDNADPNSLVSTRTQWHRDADTDGYGDAASIRSACDDPTTVDSWWTIDDTDCNDRDRAIHPGASEACNGLDDDCDLAVDEGACDGTPPVQTPPVGTPSPTPPDHPTEPPLATPTSTERPPIEPRTPRPTPTTAPTPTQIPPPSEVWQGFTRFAVAPPNQGLDYNGDGLIDNAIYEAIEIVQAEVIAIAYGAIDMMTDYPDTEDPCEAEAEGCAFTPQTNQGAKLAVNQAVEQIVSVETINEAIAATFDVAVTPWAIDLKTEGGSTDLNYYSGSVQQIDGDYGFKAERHIGLQEGFLRTEGATSYFGPGTFAITVVIEDETGESDPVVIGFNVEDALTEMVFGDPLTLGALTGGAVEVSAFVEMVESVLTSLSESGLLPEDFDDDAALAQVEEALVSACDLTCSTSGDPCFSISLIYDAETLNLVFPPK